MGFNETKTLVPWNVLDLQAKVILPQQRGLIADLSKEGIVMAPMLTPEDLAQIANPMLKANIEKYHNPILSL
jgi:hypothetical protein